MMKTQEMLELADFLAEQNVYHSNSMACHDPIIQQHVQKLAAWEKTVRFVAQAELPQSPMDWPSREVVAREIRRAMLDNPTDDSFNKRAEKREAIANDAADAILARFAAALSRPDRKCK